MRAVKVVLGWLVAVAVTTLLGALLQTQFNLAELQALGAPIPVGVRVATTGKDLVGFSPSFGTLVAVAFLIAFVVTAVLRRWIRSRRTALYTLAGGVAVLAMIGIMILVFELVPIAAARSVAGFASLVLAGAVGGLTFARLTRSAA